MIECEKMRNDSYRFVAQITLLEVFYGKSFPRFIEIQ